MKPSALGGYEFFSDVMVDALFAAGRINCSLGSPFSLAVEFCQWIVVGTLFTRAGRPSFAICSVHSMADFKEGLLHKPDFLSLSSALWGVGWGDTASYQGPLLTDTG
jgi:hypothetical protein